MPRSTSVFYSERLFQEALEQVVDYITGTGTAFIASTEEIAYKTTKHTADSTLSSQVTKQRLNIKSIRPGLFNLIVQHIHHRRNNSTGQTFSLAQVDAQFAAQCISYTGQHAAYCTRRCIGVLA